MKYTNTIGFNKLEISYILALISCNLIKSLIKCKEESEEGFNGNHWIKYKYEAILHINKIFKHIEPI